MGMDIRSKLLYGMNYRKLYDNISEDVQEQLDKDLDYGDIEYASPYYDADQDTWFVGVEISDGISYETIANLVSEVHNAEKYFLEHFGVIGELRSCKHVY